MSNTGRERREEEEEAQTPSQTDTILIIASNHRQDSLPTSHLPERERERVSVCDRVIEGAAASPGALEIDGAKVQQDMQRKKEDENRPAPIKLRRCITTREESTLRKQGHQRQGP